MSMVSREDLTEKGPEKSLLSIKKNQGGRNFQGKITVRHQGGGHKRFYRLVDFKRDKFDMPAKVVSIEYDPGRSARIALLNYPDGEKRYIVAPVELKVNDTIVSSKAQVEIKNGNCTTLEHIPVGLLIHGVELVPGEGASMARSAGSWVKVMAVEGDYAQLRLPSGEIRMVSKNALATIGQVSNPDRMHVKIGKAGRQRHRGIKPTVRGKAMNPCDHPHGGGEGNQPIGLKHPKTPWGKPALGVHTRKHHKASNKLIVQRRPSRIDK